MPLDLNIATAEQLDAVPGLEGHGFEIVQCHDERGCFTSLRELDEVPVSPTRCRTALKPVSKSF